MEISATDLSRIRELYTQGRYRQALHAAEAFGPLATWTNTPARLLAGRLAMQLGAPRLGRKLHAAAFRSSPSNLEAVYYHARYRFERFGPLASWKFVKQQTDWADASPDLRADWLAFNAFVMARLHDFDRAERFLFQAEALAPHRAWIQVERAAVLEAADRPEEAMAAARQALEFQPWFRPAVQAVAHLFQKGGKETEAAAFLEDATHHLESGIVSAHLAALQIELNRPADAKVSLDRYADLSPLLEKEGHRWLAARRADVSYALGDLDAAKRWAEVLTDDFYKHFTGNLTRALQQSPPPTGSQKKLLAVDAPATGTPTVYDLLSTFWTRPFPNPTPECVPQPDGLPDASERARGEAAGWVCREFTLTGDVAGELIAAGLPFLVSLVEVGVSQPRLVVGHDPIRESLLLRDGHDNQPVEAPLPVVLKRYRSTGPHCLVAVPKAEEHRLTAFADLPDAEAYDRLFAIHQLFTHGKQTDAKARHDAFVAEYVGHRLSKVAALAWARLTVHPVLLLDAANALLRDYPDDPTYTLTKVSALRELGRTRERLAVLEAVATKPDAEPLLVQSYAQMLLADHRFQDKAERLLRQSVRVRPQAAAGYFLLASQLWERQGFAEAADLYRFACCLDEREEQFADAYFRVAKAREQAPEALRLFQRRATKTDTPFPPAVRSLFNALLERNEPEQAFAAIDKAIGKLREPTGEVELHLARPERPKSARPHTESALSELLLFRAEAHARFGHFAKADADLEAAKPLTSPATWHRTVARVAKCKPEPSAVLDHLKLAIDADPNWHEGHRHVVGVLVEAHGIVAARALVSTLATRFPHTYPVQRLRAELLSPTTEDSAILAVRNVMDLCPHDAWARRQLALVLADRKRDSEALEQIHAAGAAEPDHPSHFAVLGHVHRRAERTDDALDTYREAIRRDVDHELAIGELVRLARSRKDRKENLRFIAEQLHAQPHGGDGLVAYRDQVLTLASEEDDNDDLLEELREELEAILDARPDLWQAWSLMIQQLGLMQRLDEAAAVADDAVERFPLQAQLWADLARVCGAKEQPEDRVEALRMAVAVAPDWPPAAQELADALADADEEDEAVKVLEQAASRNAHDASNQAALADRLWNAGQSEEALEKAKLAVRLDPGFDAAWRMVMHWSDRLDRPTEVIDLARELTAARPGDARGWLKLSRLLHDPEQNVEALAALETVIQLDPRNIEAHDQKAERLADLGRYDEAIEAARPAELAGEETPFVLQGRAAWVEAKRGNYTKAIVPMKNLVKIEPEYFWGWQQLAEWYNETDQADEYLSASAELVRLKPDHPMPLTMRGEAKLKTGDRAGGKADLRDALRLAPQYAPAAAILFDACLADQEIRDARIALAVLQEHAGGSEVLVKQVQLACRTDDAEAALRTLADLAGTPSEGPPVAMQLAVSEIEKAGWEERAAKVLHEAFTNDEPFTPWAPLFWLDTTAGEEASFDDRLAAVDAAIAAHPTFAAAYDRKAELLAAVGRFDEAAAACHAPAAGDPPALTLRGRAAWLEAKRGQRAKAITLMKQVVADDPEYLWGWRNLAQWYDAEGRQKECLDAAEQMVKLSPDDPVAHGYRGEARRALGDRAGAKADFAKAFDLDPAFGAAGLHLIAEQLLAGEIEAAARTLARVQEHADGPVLKLRAAQVAAKQKNLGAARERLRAVATDADTPTGLLREAAQALDNQGWVAEVDDELGAIVAGAETTPAAAAVWTERLIVHEKGWHVLDALPGIFEKNPNAAREATLAYAVAMAGHGHPDKTATTIHRFADHLRTDPQSWGRAGAALAEAKLFALAASWLGDWKQRDGVDAGMLQALADSLRAQDRDAEATDVAKAAAQMPGPPAVLADFRGWLALEAAVAGHAEEAGTLLSSIDRVGLPDRVRLVVAVAEALVMVQRAGPEAKPAAFSDAKEHLHAAAGACAAADVPPGLARWFKVATKRLAADTGGFAAKLWAWWQQSRPWVK
ncbi:tetratricopeptide repeat protein [Limnoglobus roseus]|uniref:Tetratricopeptide repeat protein n=1 Tax=Limnoglobus roseus TaxID=2598579 RepID=A0A5C1ADP6_9BACT|nr:hypothetical protein [Limnoglobus roseus]QEL16126.1 tetratricopeptide repeat protein [Limnoglobus roseus]